MKLPDHTEATSTDDFNRLWRQWVMSQAVIIYTAAIASGRQSNLHAVADEILQWVMRKPAP